MNTKYRWLDLKWSDAAFCRISAFTTAQMDEIWQMISDSFNEAKSDPFTEEAAANISYFISTESDFFASLFNYASWDDLFEANKDNPDIVFCVYNQYKMDKEKQHERKNERPAHRRPRRNGRRDARILRIR